MQIQVSKDNVSILNTDLTHVGEYNVDKLTFSFSQEYTDDLVKCAIFTNNAGKSYQTSILNNECFIPAEVLQERGNVIFGVYAYKIIEDKLELRYSPHPTYFDVSIGSYNSEAEESQEITPTQFEQYMQALQNGLNQVQESIKELNQATDNANDLVDEINQKLENGEFIGPQGPTGPQGEPGKDGTNGIDGVGITTITSGQATEENGNTITPITVEKTDGSSETFNVSAKNGIDGKNGQNGKDGINGTNGIDGQDGITPNIQIGTVETLEPTEQASVTRTGTDEEPLLNFGIPKGDKGDPGEVTEEILDNIVAKQTATDSIININDALKYKNFDFKVDGAYEQKTTTGKQLYNVKDKSEVYNDITVDDDDWITINIDNTSGSSSIYANYYTNNLNLKANTNYNVFLEVKNISGTGNLRIISYFYQGEVQTEGQFITYWNYDLTQLQSNKIYNKIATTVSEEIMQSIKSDGLKTFFEVPVGQSGSVTFRISVIEDTTKTPENFVYESYTGGIASPNPNYPQEITPLNFDKIMTSGQNLFDINDIAGDNVTNNNFIKTTVDDDDFIHVEINNTNGSYEAFANYWTKPSKKLLPNHDYLIAVEVKEYNGNGYNNYVGTESGTQFKTGFSDWNKKTGILTSTVTTKDNFDNAYYMLRTFIQCKAYSTVSITYRISIIADLTVNQENFVYKPYQAIDYSIDLQGNEIVSLPNGVKDELTIDKEGNVNLVKKVGKFLLKSVDKWDLIGETETYWGYANYHLSDSAKYSYCLSNYFSSDEDNRLIRTLTEVYCRFPKSLGIDVSDSDKFKQWTTNNEVYGYYEKTTPQIISLGKLENLITTENGSNTFAINGNIDTQISTTYALDLKKYIDNKIAKVSTAVIGE